MHVLFVRHAHADPANKHGLADKDRPLSDRGVKRFRTVCEQLVGILDKPRAIFSSPLLRAKQTAELLARVWRGVPVDILPALTDGDWPEMCEAILDLELDDDETVIVVGHEGWMSRLTARLLGSTAGPAFAYRKGGMALLDVRRKDKDHATLVWFIPPGILRSLRRS